MAGNDELDAVITIDLVQPSRMDDQQAAGSDGNKRRRIMSSSDGRVDESAAGGHGGAGPLAKVEVRASKLRKCSTYFEACMSERWAQSSSGSRTKFKLEVQTEVQYYEDCFARMNFLFHPIASVTDCVELLKVASQIDFQDVVDIGVKYLAAAPWSDEEESLVRDFCLSYYFGECDSLRDLTVRLKDLPSGVQKKQAKLSCSAMNLLSLLLRNAIPDGTKSLAEVREGARICPEPRKKFAVAFHVIMSGSESGAVCEPVVEFAMALVTQEAERLLKEISKHALSSSDHGDETRHAVYRFCWLFKVAHHSNVAQGIVELLVNDGHYHVLCALRTGFYADEASVAITVVKKWARLVYGVFEDVLAGELFLNSSQRSTLFLQGRWLLFGKFLNRSEAQLAAFVTRFITTLPQRQQEECWAGTFIDHHEGPSCEAYAMWVSHMVTKIAPRPPRLPTGSSNSSNVKEYTSTSSE